MVSVIPLICYQVHYKGFTLSLRMPFTNLKKVKTIVSLSASKVRQKEKDREES